MSVIFLGFRDLWVCDRFKDVVVLIVVVIRDFFIVMRRLI